MTVFMAGIIANRSPNAYYNGRRGGGGTHQGSVWQTSAFLEKQPGTFVELFKGGAEVVADFGSDSIGIRQALGPFQTVHLEPEDVQAELVTLQQRISQ